MSKKVKFYLDTEFAEQPGTIQLISIGIVSERGDTFYAENSHFNQNSANDWVKANVLPKLKYWGKKILSEGTVRIDGTLSGEGENQRKINFHKVYGGPDLIKKHLLNWINLSIDKADDPSPEFWAYFADYDWVVFCWIFGTMMELPDHFPKYCLDLKQKMHTLNVGGAWKREVCPDPIDEHFALADAKWNMKLDEELEKRVVMYNTQP